MMTTVTPIVAFAQSAIDYRIIVRTMTNDSWTDGYGTDNWIYMTMHGENGTKKVELKGSHENGDTDKFTYSTKDIGVIKKITVDVDGKLADKWGPLDIKILRDASADSVDLADGWSSFYIGKEIGYDPVSFKPNKISPKAVTIKETGESIDTSLTQTFVNYADNLRSPTEQNLMNFKERWDHVHSVGVSTQNVDSFGSSLTLSYEYNNKSPGSEHKFGVAAQQSWTKTIGKLTSTSDDFKKGSTFDWTIEVPRNTFFLRKLTFRIPSEAEIYTDGLGQSFAIRKLTGKIAPLANAGATQAIPERDLSDNIVPVSLSYLENEYFRHMKIDDVKSIFRKQMDDWMARGWVIEDTALEKGVNGKNALQIVYGSGTKHGNRFINTTGKNWLDQSYESGTKFTFVEFARDEWSVYLRDESRNMNVALDLFTKEAKFNVGPQGISNLSKFATIQSASR